MVTELAEKGSLSDAISKGVFKQEQAPGVNLPVALLCLLDIARGLQYLHSCGIVSAPACLRCARGAARCQRQPCHLPGSTPASAPAPAPAPQVHGDLKPENVLLKAAKSDRRGFVCKLGDFGLSRCAKQAVFVPWGLHVSLAHISPRDW